MDRVEKIAKNIKSCG